MRRRSGWLAGALLVLLALFGWRRSRRHGTGEAPPAARRTTRRAGQRLLPIGAALLVGVAVVVGLTVGRPGATSTRFPAARGTGVPTAQSATRVAIRPRPSPVRPPPAPTRPPAPTEVGATPQPTATPTVVERLAVGGTPVAAVRARGRLRGMGYNPTYATADVAEPLRRDRIGRDMRLMSQVGVDMVLGWEPGVFDQTLLDAAAANGIGVIMPFDLKPDWDYADADLRRRVLRDVGDWVLRYRDQPAVVMWGVGNEVTIEMDDPGRRAFAAFYVQVVDLVRSLDPSRPVVLREAEDVFAPYLAEAFGRRQGVWVDPPPTAAPEDTPAPIEEDEPTPTETPEPTAMPRPVIRAPEGFVYGVNFYTERVGPALADWVPNTGLDAPLIVSEYAPAGVGRARRSEGFLKLHELISEGGGARVLGEAPYTWTTAGPEAVDDYFGLVDADGQPVDNTLAAVAGMYGVSPPAWTHVAEPRQQLANVADLPRLLGEAAASDAQLTGRDADDVRESVAAEAQTAAAELGVDPMADDEGSQRARRIVELLGWARELSSLHDAEARRFFPGMHEALPLLNGMARWSLGDASAIDTAEGFTAAVLRRDLSALR